MLSSTLDLFSIMSGGFCLLKVTGRVPWPFPESVSDSSTKPSFPVQPWRLPGEWCLGRWPLTSHPIFQPQLLKAVDSFAIAVDHMLYALLSVFGSPRIENLKYISPSGKVTHHHE